MKLAWSRLSVADLRELRRYSVDRWGEAVAKRYLADLRDTALRTADDPRRARVLRSDLRLVRTGSHYLFVHVDTAGEVLTVARVLHSSMDLERHLPPD